MTKITAFFQLIRLPNLLIVGLTQYLLRYCILEPYYRRFDIAASLTSFEFFILVIATILIAAAGYIVNDIYDWEIDQINKPHKTFIPSLFTVRNAWWLYHGLNAAGLLISLWLANSVGKLELILLFPLFAIPLWLYSWKLKKMPLIGNVLIAAFCSAVALLVIYAELDAFSNLVMASLDAGKTIFYVFMGYANFAFYSTIFREIIKDMEDVQGDVAKDCRTLPIVWGIPRAKIVATIFGIILLAFITGLLYLQFHLGGAWWLGSLYLLVTVVSPVLYSLQNLREANNKAQFHKLSTLSKLVMLGGLLYLPLFFVLFIKNGLV